MVPTCTLAGGAALSEETSEYTPPSPAIRKLDCFAVRQGNKEALRHIECLAPSELFRARGNRWWLDCRQSRSVRWAARCSGGL